MQSLSAACSGASQGVWTCAPVLGRLPWPGLHPEAASVGVMSALMTVRPLCARKQLP